MSEKYVAYLKTGCGVCDSVKAWLIDNDIEYDYKNFISEPPSIKELTWISSQLPNGPRGLLHPIKVENNDPYYVAYIKGLEEILNDEQYISILQRFPDLLLKPILITTKSSNFIVGWDDKKLNETFRSEKVAIERECDC